MAIDIKRLVICVHKGAYPLTEGMIYLMSEYDKPSSDYCNICSLTEEFIGTFSKTRFILLTDFLQGEDYDKDFVLHLCE